MTAFTSFLHFISLIIITTASSAPNANSTVVSPNKLCPTTRNPKLCFRVLNSTDPTVDLPHLGRKALKSTQQSIARALGEAGALIKSEQNPEMLERYSECSGIFASFSHHIAEYSKLLASKQYDQNLTAAAANAYIEGAGCDLSFLMPPSEPARLKAASDELLDLASVLQAIGEQLEGDKN